MATSFVQYWPLDLQQSKLAKCKLVKILDKNLATSQKIAKWENLAKSGPTEENTQF